MAPEAALPGLYIHVPFCKTKCPYCDFYSVTDEDLVDLWLDAMDREMAGYRELFPSFDTIYLGGGTPSFLSEGAMERLMKSVRNNWSPTPGEEVTLEANPDDVTKEKLSLYRSLGINRISLGVQSFDDGDLVFLKRRHTADGALKAVDLVRSSDFDNFGIDLMYGLKGQTRKKWLKTLAQAVAFDPAHISCYQLTIEDRTPFGLLKAKGDLKRLSEKTEKDFFLDTSRFLGERGFIHYEISNFCRTERYASRHNTKYWAHAPYLGIGPAAHSFRQGKRWWNCRSIEGYCRSLERGIMPVEDHEILTQEQIRLENLYFGFRTAKGLGVDDLGPEGPGSRALAELASAGLVTVRDGKITPTVKGFLVADRLPLMFE